MAPRLLIIDDDARLCAMLASYLEQNHFAVSKAGDGSSGLAALQSANPAIDLVILDLMLPDMDGLEIVQRLRSTGVDTPVLMLSALGRASNRVEGLDAGVDDYLAKPYEPEELMARLKALVRRAEGRTHSAIIIYGQFECHLKPIEAWPALWRDWAQATGLG